MADKKGMRRAGREGALGDHFATVLTGAQQGDHLAFSRLYRALAPAVGGYLRLQGSPEPDELTNEVFLGIFNAISSFEGDEDRFRSWVFTIAHHRLIDERRRLGRRPARADDAATDLAATVGGDVEDEAMRRISVERVRGLCERLTPEQRDVLLLRLVSGLSIEEVADALGKPVTAIKALQRRALGAARRLLAPEGVSR